MKSKELKEKLVSLGMESEKAAGRLILWYQLATLAAVLEISMIINVITGFSLGIFMWLIALILVLEVKPIIAKKCETSLDKLQKNVKVAKIICALFFVVLVLSYGFAFFKVFYLGIY